MEHTRKMVLLPEETMVKLKNTGPANNTITSAQTPGDPVSRIDDELLKILNSNRNDSDKWIEYYQALRRFLFFHENGDKRPTSITKKPYQEKEEESPYPADMIIKGVPKTYRQKAEGLIEHIFTAVVDKLYVIVKMNM